MAKAEFIPDGDQIREWRGEFQKDICRSLISHPRVVLKGPRQWSGKTTAVALVATWYILHGGRVACAMPTLRQGSRIVIGRILSWVKSLEEDYGIRRESKAKEWVEWDNGARLFPLSSDDSAQRGTQGYTIHLLIVDEGHESSTAVVGPMFPIASVAIAEGSGHIIILGVGGPHDSLIQTMQRNELFRTCWIRPAQIAAENELARVGLENDRALQSERDWKQYYECEEVLVGTRLILPRISAMPRGMDWRDERYAIGIDVGKLQDHTVIAVLGVTQSGRGLGDMSAVLRRDFKLPLFGTNREQAEQIMELTAPYRAKMYTSSGGLIELNGPGQGLYEALMEAGWITLGGIHINDKRKNFLIGKVQMMAEHDEFGVPDDNARSELGALTYSVNEKGVIDWEHSDLFSAVYVGIAAV